MLDATLVVFALWAAWSVTEVWLTAPRWVWIVSACALGIVAQVVLRRDWWRGVGLGGAAAALMTLTDLILVASDLLVLRVAALRSGRR